MIKQRSRVRIMPGIVVAGVALLVGCAAQPVTRTVTTEQVTTAPPPPMVVRTTTTRDVDTAPVYAPAQRRHLTPADEVVTEETTETGPAYIPTVRTTTTRSTTETTSGAATR